jgi:hypothetical protein
VAGRSKSQPHQGRRGEVHPRRPVGRQEVVERSVDERDRYGGVGVHHLHRPGQVAPGDRAAQHRRPVDDPLPRRRQPLPDRKTPPRRIVIWSR